MRTSGGPVADSNDQSGVPRRARALLTKTWNDGEAAIIRQLLETYGIPCQVVSDIPHTLMPLSVDGLGEIRILVPTSRLDEARALIADHRRDGLRVIRGGKQPADETRDDEPSEGQGGGG